MSANPYEISEFNPTPHHKLKHHKHWHKANEIFGILSEASNTGIVINIIDMFQHSIMLIASGAFAFFAHYADAFIYVFKALIRLTKLIGRSCFDITFEEDVAEHNKTQTILDLLALLFFTTTIILLTAVSGIIAPMMGWISAFIGLVIVGYSDYYLTQVDARQELELELGNLILLTKDYLQAKLKPEQNNTEALDKQFLILQACASAFQTKNKSFKLYGMLIVGIAALLICSSATTFTTGMTFVVLGIIAKAASAFLAGIACFRFHNYLQSKNKKEETNSEHRFSQFLESKNFFASKPCTAKDLVEEYAKQRGMTLELAPSSP